MNSIFKTFLLVLALSTVASAQLTRDYRTHTRGMLWQTVFNTGEIGRAYDDGASGSLPDNHSMEWPGNSAFRLGEEKFDGFYNAFGGGIWIGADTGKVGNRKFFTLANGGIVECGMVSDNGGNAIPVEGMFSYPVSIEKITNFPLNADGSVNANYNPNEAEEIIKAKWDTPIGVTVTRTSRAWSFPDYDDFIIYEYELENTGNRRAQGASLDTLYEMTVTFALATSPSMVAYQRQYGRWSSGDMNSEHMYNRFDLKRWLWYGHTRDGKPDPTYFNQWAASGEHGGGLTAPASVGFMPLYFDHDHLAKFRAVPQTKFYVNTQDAINDHKYIWDKTLANGITPANDARFKQPYLTRTENTNFQPTKAADWLDGKMLRKTPPFIPGRLQLKGQLVQDESKITKYWFGRAQMVVTQAYTQANAKAYGFGPYVLPPHEKIKFTIAEVAGYGPGVEKDSIYNDFGGGTGDTPVEPGPYFHSVPSWYNTLTYPYLNKTPGLTMGSTYLKNYPLPSYVNSKVISMRDVADRAIQIYKGGSVIKYDTLQYEPLNSPSTGVYSPLFIPCPSPIISVYGEGPILSKISWGPQVESITSSTAGFAKLHAPLSHYKVLRAINPIGPWTVLDSVSKGDIRYFDAEKKLYIFNDATAHLNTTYYYAVVSVDALGGKSGLTNLTKHDAQFVAVKTIGKVYAAPNPFIVTSGYSDNSNKIGIYGLPEHATINVYSYAGQHIQTIEHDAPKYSTAWVQISRNNQWIASGVYYFTVEDKTTHDKAWGKFVIIH